MRCINEIKYSLTWSKTLANAETSGIGLPLKGEIPTAERIKFEGAFARSACMNNGKFVESLGEIGYTLPVVY